jgi:hypothetical protein
VGSKLATSRLLLTMRGMSQSKLSQMGASKVSREFYVLDGSQLMVVLALQKLLWPTPATSTYEIGTTDVRDDKVMFQIDDEQVWCT